VSLEINGTGKHLHLLAKFARKSERVSAKSARISARSAKISARSARISARISGNCKFRKNLN
jgi:hypothetical protein